MLKPNSIASEKSVENDANFKSVPRGLYSLRSKANIENIFQQEFLQSTEKPSLCISSSSLPIISENRGRMPNLHDKFTPTTERSDDKVGVLKEQCARSASSFSTNKQSFDRITVAKAFRELQTRLQMKRTKKASDLSHTLPWAPKKDTESKIQIPPKPLCTKKLENFKQPPYPLTNDSERDKQVYEERINSIVSCSTNLDQSSVGDYNDNSQVLKVMSALDRTKYQCADCTTEPLANHNHVSRSKTSNGTLNRKKQSTVVQPILENVSHVSSLSHKLCHLSEVVARSEEEPIFQPELHVEHKIIYNFPVVAQHDKSNDVTSQRFTVHTEKPKKKKFFDIIDVNEHLQINAQSKSEEAIMMSLLIRFLNKYKNFIESAEKRLKQIVFSKWSFNHKYNKEKVYWDRNLQKKMDTLFRYKKLADIEYQNRIATFAQLTGPKKHQFGKKLICLTQAQAAVECQQKKVKETKRTRCHVLGFLVLGNVVKQVVLSRITEVLQLLTFSTMIENLQIVSKIVKCDSSLALNIIKATRGISTQKNDSVELAKTFFRELTQLKTFQHQRIVLKLAAVTESIKNREKRYCAVRLLGAFLVKHDQCLRLSTFLSLKHYTWAVRSFVKDFAASRHEYRNSWLPMLHRFQEMTSATNSRQVCCSTACYPVESLTSSITRGSLSTSKLYPNDDTKKLSIFPETKKNSIKILPDAIKVSSNSIKASPDAIKVSSSTNSRCRPNHTDDGSRVNIAQRKILMFDTLLSHEEPVESKLKMQHPVTIVEKSQQAHQISSHGKEAVFCQNAQKKNFDTQIFTEQKKCRTPQKNGLQHTLRCRVATISVHANNNRNKAETFKERKANTVSAERPDIKFNARRRQISTIKEIDKHAEKLNAAESIYGNNEKGESAKDNTSKTFNVPTFNSSKNVLTVLSKKTQMGRQSNLSFENQEL